MMADARALSLAGDENFPGCVSLFVVVKFFTFAESVALHTHRFRLLFNSPTNSRVFLLPLFHSLLQEFFFFFTLPVLHQRPLISTLHQPCCSPDYLR